MAGRVEAEELVMDTVAPGDLSHLYVVWDMLYSLWLFGVAVVGALFVAALISLLVVWVCGLFSTRP